MPPGQEARCLKARPVAARPFRVVSSPPPAAPREAAHLGPRPARLGAGRGKGRGRDLGQELGEARARGGDLREAEWCGGGREGGITNRGKHRVWLAGGQPPRQARETAASAAWLTDNYRAAPQAPPPRGGDSSERMPRFAAAARHTPSTATPQPTAASGERRLACTLLKSGCVCGGGTCSAWSRCAASNTCAEPRPEGSLVG